MKILSLYWIFFVHKNVKKTKILEKIEFINAGHPPIWKDIGQAADFLGIGKA